MDGDNTLEICKDATTRTLKALFAKLAEHNVILEGLILKTNMVISGKKCPIQAGSQEIAKETVETFLEVVPKEIAGIVFLSGGQTPTQATENLAEINMVIGSPWQLSFSYGRALQDEALMAWAGKNENVERAQKAFIERVKKVSEARSQRPFQS
jgi:fructose-bisphosphate aldolase class I